MQVAADVMALHFLFYFILSSLSFVGGYSGGLKFCCPAVAKLNAKPVLISKM